MKKNSVLLIIMVTTLMLNAQNESKLVIDASNSQTNDNPLLRLSSGTDLLWISSDHPANSYLGYKAGEKNMTGFANTAIGRSALYAPTGIPLCNLFSL